MSGEKQPCGKIIWDGFYSHACGKTAKHERSGHWYCGVHDPVRRSARFEAKSKKWDAESRVRSAGGEVRRRESDLLDAVRDSDEAALPAPVLRALDWLRQAEADRDEAQRALAALGA